MNIATVVIWYNPNVNITQNLKTYSSLFKKVYIVDNSKTDNSFLAKSIPNSLYIPNYKNIGIAAALNIGCRQAYTDKFEWIMTMDQDSFWATDEIKKYLSIIDSKILQNKYFSFAPSLIQAEIPISYYQDFKNWIKKIFHIHKKISGNHFTPEFQTPMVVITSGNVISLKIWEELHGFYEPFFIDEVDHEFCMRLISKYPEAILQINTVMMNHCIGDPKKYLFPHSDFHSALRLYYCVRNTLYMNDMFPKFTQQCHRIEFYKAIFKENCKYLDFKKIFYMIRGYLDYKKGILGEYK